MSNSGDANFERLWAQARRRLHATDRGKQELHIGRPDGYEADPEAEILIPYSDRAAHLHAIGVTRSGKSRFLADLIRQDIKAGQGVCVIDPHGELYDLTVNWLAQNSAVQKLRKNIHPVNFSDTGSVFRFNPLHIDKPEEAYFVAGNITQAITRIFGGNNATDTPLTTYVLDIVCTILALRRLPLAAAKYFLLNSDAGKQIRNQISQGAPDEYFRQLGLELSNLSPRDFRETVGSAQRRLHRFFSTPLVERIFSTTENTINLRQAMDERHVLLFNTSVQNQAIQAEALRGIGMLLVNNIFGTATMRDPKDKPSPFFLYIDECQNYLSNDIEDILSQASKRGLYLTLAHQFLWQLRNADEVIYHGVMAGAQLKAVFGIKFEDAEMLVDDLFADEVDFERVKEKIQSPHVVGNKKTIVRGVNQSKGTGATETSGDGLTLGFTTSETDANARSRGRTSARGTVFTENEMQSEGQSEFIPTDPALEASGITGIVSAGIGSGFGVSQVEGEIDTESESHAKTTGQSVALNRLRTKGTSTSSTTGTSENETLESVYQWFSTTAHSLEEERYRLKRRIANQPKRHGFLAVGKRGTVGFTTRNIPDPLYIPKAEALLLNQLRESSPWISRPEEIQLELEQIKKLQGSAGNEPQEVDDFFE